MSRTTQRNLIALAMLAFLFLLAVTGGGLATGLLYVAPALLLLVPMLSDRGERGVMALAERLPRLRDRAAAAASPLPAPPFASLLARGGRLIGAGLAVRPPPHLA